MAGGDEVRKVSARPTCHDEGVEQCFNYLSPVTSRIARLLGPGSRPHPAQQRPDITREESAILDRVRPYTMTSEERVVALIDAIGYLTRHQIPGAVVECGVWRGGSSMAAALALKTAGDTGRELYLYDTFEGMTNPTVVDRSHDGLPAADQLSAAPAGTGVWCRAGLEEVRANLLSTGYPEEKMHFVRGRVEDTLPATVSGQGRAPSAGHRLVRVDQARVGATLSAPGPGRDPHH